MRRFAGVTPLLLVVSLVGVLGGAICRLWWTETGADTLWALTALTMLVPATWAMLRGLAHRLAGVDVIAVLAIAGAIALREFLVAAVIGLMLATGRALEEYAANRAERELASLLQRAPRFARLIRAGVVENVPIDEVRPGDQVVVNGGDVVPVDGLLLDASAVLDESALTGESALVERGPHETVRSGTVNASGPFQMRAASSAADSTYAGVIRMVEAARRSKAPLQRLADRYAQWFVPATLAIAGGAWAASQSADRALAVLVVATPCPLLLAAPVAIVSGVSRAARRGIVVKGGAALETLARAQALYLDKTGTLTVGAPQLERTVVAEGRDEGELLTAAASLDQLSSHVFAGAIVRAALRRGLILSLPSGVAEEPGAGISGTVNGRGVRIGKFDWVTGSKIAPADLRLRRRVSRVEGSVIFVAIDGVLEGAFVFDDPIRPDAPRAIRMLKSIGISEITMLTGDRATVANSVGAALGVDTVLAELSPEDKVRAVGQSKARRVTLMVGDGINDAPALASADVGIAMGARGATSSSEAADVVLVVDRLDRLVEALRIARRSRGIAVQSIILGMSLSFVAMGFAAIGFLPPVAGAFLQEGIDALAILSALRALGGPALQQTKRRLPRETAALLRREHEEIRPLVERLREYADQTADAGPGAKACSFDGVRGTLGQILAHERADESEVYRTIASAMGGDDPLAAMSRTHQEIFHLGRALERVLDECAIEAPDSEDFADLRRLLYALHAVLRLNIAQEEELYFSLDPDFVGG
jgi:heavy metal translocating P-type ATPase